MDSNKMAVEYQPLSADQVKDLQRKVNDTQAWKQLKWGSHGPEGKDPKQIRTLNDLDTDHLEAILITQPHIGNTYRAAILALLHRRYKNLPDEPDQMDEGPHPPQDEDDRLPGRWNDRLNR